MEERLKRRLIGGAVLVSLVVIFVPMLLETPAKLNKAIKGTNIPAMPKKPVGSEVNILPSFDQSVSRNESSLEIVPKKPKSATTSSNNKTGKIARTSPSAWIIQVASFSNRKNADKLVKRLKKGDLPAHIEFTSVQGKRFYRVRVGPEVDRKLAEKMVKRINRDYIDEIKKKVTLIRYP
ncbi:MAG: SPOR domain-containing protein [gamma proteobacterium endosymbiont of Lamellibrachia anaximandri]|nr:SPOR domain-containing protein [gamma proteobacterium endosymbiont of Lamellibrachia anaximandri]MBL3535229.1 SPOR domain-containing protein [gamma proteobacterium endosymbiont of Lamellibrachia anaximandri]